MPIAHGTDGLGSIRLPAAVCGLVGLKPGRGVAREEDEGWFGMSVHGPIATTPADAALLLSVLAERPEWAAVTEPGPQRIAVSRRWHRRGWPAVALPAARVAAFTGMWNLAGYPAITVPIGRHPSYDLATCVQLVAAPGGEPLLLGLAAALEAANPWPRTV